MARNRITVEKRRKCRNIRRTDRSAERRGIEFHRCKGTDF